MGPILKSRFFGKNILIQGLGLNGGGLGTALFFVTRGFEVTITDLKSSEELTPTLEQLSAYSDLISYRLGEHKEDEFRRADIVVKGPGVRPDNKFIKAAREKGAEITSDIALFLEFAPCKVYALTGSKGKSSTVSVIYEIFKAESENSFLGGNITISPLTFIDKLNKDSRVILELSSWQLRDLGELRNSFAGTALTNILDDHQNYYSSIRDYIDDKVIIMRDQGPGDFTIIPRTDTYLKPEHIQTGAEIFTYSAPGPGSLHQEGRTGIEETDKNREKKESAPEAAIYYKGNEGVIRFKGENRILFDKNLIKVPGVHIEGNILLAAAFCFLAGIDVRYIRSGIEQFKGAPFRLEKVGEWKGITFINDTTATIPDAAYFALHSFEAPVIWIAGGSDKKLDFSVLKPAASIPKKILLLTGEGTDKMKPWLDRPDIIENSSLDYLFEKALEAAVSGDVVLFSPGCTSFGLFANEFHRGREFNRLVSLLV